MPNNEILDNIDSVIEIGINLLLGKANPMGIAWVTSHVIVVLEIIVLAKFVCIFIDVV